MVKAIESRRRWLENPVHDFMNPLLNSLDGNPTPGWDRILNDGWVDRSDRGMADAPSGLGRGSARLGELRDARLMALVHIGEDLRNSLRKNGVGEDWVWECVGHAVAEATKENFSEYEVDKMKRAGRSLGPTYDVDAFRDVIREEVKLEGTPAYIP